MQLELLAPVRDLASGLAAIHAGADALYVGAPRFGARAAVGNSLDHIRALVLEAHAFEVRVYATLNILLRDEELDDAQRMAWDLHAVGVDALIVQDMAWMRMELPPIELHASTQADNRTLERVQFLEQIGFTRVVLARELSPRQIGEIRRHTSVELEAFVHGALCVSYSGQCYLSEYLGGRSANRGVCAQPCRQAYGLQTLGGEHLGQGHLLSLRDLHRAEHLEAFLEAGVSSFKIEGRLKDLAYVQNVTAYYSQALDTLIANRHGARRASIGSSAVRFTPDPHLTFARPFTPYILDRRVGNLAHIASPKSMGELVGRVQRVAGSHFWLDSMAELHNGDGFAIVSGGVVHGVRAERAQGRKVEVRSMPRGVRVGDRVYRNSNAEARRQLATPQCQRALRAKISLVMHADGTYRLLLVDEGGRASSIDLPAGLDVARNPSKQRAAWVRQLGASADRRMRFERVEVCDAIPFLPIGEMNALRRRLVDSHMEMLSERRLPVRLGKRTPAPYPLPLPRDARINVTNRLAREFYRDCGVEIEGDAPEGRLPAELMRMAYCVRWELGLCPHQTGSRKADPLRMVGARRPLYLHFDCARCEMVVGATP